jgi:non-ribosomal peptide synthase protein (TIGR01720 family)
LLAQAVAQLWRRHDALRLRFERDADGWRQIYGAAGGEAPFTWVDLADTPLEAQPGAIEATAASFQTNLDLAAGPLFQVAYFHLGHGAPGRLLIVAHRLVADEDALQIVLEDFQMVYAQLSQGQPALLPPKTTAFGAWAAQLQARAESDELSAQLDYWLAQQSAPVLPVELTGGPHGVAAAHTVQVELSTEETEALLQEANAAYSTSTEELLLTALAQALAEHTDQTEATVARHLRGRELFADGQSEPARTVGCFTLLAPTRLDLDALAAPGKAIMAVKEQIRQAPGDGSGYGLLRYLSPDGAIRAQLAELPQPEVGFSYQPTAVFGAPGADDMPFKMAAESIGATRHLEATRPFLLEIDARVGANGRLQLTFTYSANHHRRETIAALAVAYLDKLRALIAHCQDPEAGGVTASDFADFGWDADDLSDIMAQLGNLE